MKHKQGDIVRIKSGFHKTDTGVIPTMMIPYVGSEAVVEHVDPERKLYQIKVLVPEIRGAIRFNATERMIEPEINENMLEAARSLEGWPGVLPEFATVLYEAMRAARFKEAK